MHIRVVCTHSTLLFRVWMKTKQYLCHSAYFERNGVFTHAEALITFHVRNHQVDIRCTGSDAGIIKQVSEYMQYVFGHRPIGLRISDPEQYSHFSTFNYVRI